MPSETLKIESKKQKFLIFAYNMRAGYWGKVYFSGKIGKSEISGN
jgi:hypothetical protein